MVGFYITNMIESKSICKEDLNEFLKNKEKEILTIARNHTEEIVKKELALMDFELLLSSHLSEKQIQELNNKSRKLREESWNELNKEFNGNYNEIIKSLDKF